MNDNNKKDRRDALIVFFLLAIVFAFFYQSPGWNENSRLSLIHAIVEDHSLSIDNFYAKPGTSTWDVAIYDGHYYSDKAIGPAIIGSIFYFPIYWILNITNTFNLLFVHKILTFLVVGIPSAIAGSLMYLISLHILENRFRAFIITLAITLGTMSLPYSSALFSHQLTASFLFIAFVMIFFLREQTRKKTKGIHLFSIGLLCGWAFISEYTSAIIIVFLIAYYLTIILKAPYQRKIKAFILPLIGGTIPLLFQLIYNKLCFGNYLTIGYNKMALDAFSSGMGQGLMGIGLPNFKVIYYMTFHPGKGLFWQSPILILAFLGLISAIIQRRYIREVGLSFLIISCYITIISGYYMWWGGRAFGVRHLIPVLPFFSLLLVFVSRKLNCALIGLSIISIMQMFIAAASSIIVPEEWIKQIASASAFDYLEIYDYSLKQLIDGKFIFNLGNSWFGLNSWASLTPIFILIVVTTVVFFWKDIRNWATKH